MTETEYESKVFKEKGLTTAQLERFLKCEQLLFDTLKKLSEKINERCARLEMLMFQMVEDCKVRREIDECEVKIDKYLSEIKKDNAQAKKAAKTKDKK